jgi:hypothetical protein
VARRGAVSAALWLLFAAASLTGGRVFNGVDVWIKPQKFALSVAVHFATLAWALSWLSESGAGRAIAARLRRDGRAKRPDGGALHRGSGGGFGQASPFHESAPFHEVAYTLMGVGAVILVGLSFEVGRRAATDREARIGPGLRWGLALGLMAGSAATLVIGGCLGSQSSHHVGAQLSDAEGLPFVGWAMATGDLRPAHFFATHLMQAAPVAGLAADRFGGRAPRLKVAAVSAAWLGLTVWMFLQALSGRPFLPV